MILQAFKTEEKIEVKSIVELKELLLFCNPKMLQHYKIQIERQRPDIQIVGIGVGIKKIEAKGKPTRYERIESQEHGLKIVKRS